MSTKMSNMTEKFTVCFTFSFEYFLFLFFDTLSLLSSRHTLSSHTHKHSQSPSHELNSGYGGQTVRRDDDGSGDGYEEEGDERRAQARVAFGGEQEPIRSVSHQAPRYLGHVQEG